MKYLLDTDHVSLLFQGNSRIDWNLLRHATDDVAITVITVEEELVGWLTSLNKTRDKDDRATIYQRMSVTTMLLSDWPVVPYSVPAMNIYDSLLRMRLNVRAYDLKIAAIALEHSAVVVTRNRRDFSRVPGLTLTDWTV